MYAVIIEIIRRRYGIDCGGVRAPLFNLTPEDETIIEESRKMIEEATARYIK